MSRFTIQDLSEENSKKVLTNSYDSRFFLIHDWGIKDRYPEIDGQIRLRHLSGFYLDKYLHYQLKGVKNLKNGKYFCSRDILRYLIETNVPTILFVVDNTLEKTYWFYLDKKKIAELNLDRDNKGRTLNLQEGEFNKQNSAEVNNQWQRIAKKDSYNELNESLSKIIADFHHNVRKCVGLLYLLQRVEKAKLAELFASLLSIKANEVEVIIEKLREQQIISETYQLYLVENDQIGIECLFDLVASLELGSLEKTFKEKDDIKLINKQLAKIKHPKVDKYFDDQFNNMLKLFTNPTNNDMLLDNLEILEVFSFRDPKTAIQILETVIEPKKILPPKKHRTPIGIYAGASYRDLISKVIGRLDDLRFLETKKVMKHLLTLSEKRVLVIQRDFDELIEHLAQYNIDALKIIGYAQQKTIINELEKLTDAQLSDHVGVILKIAKELLEPSFEGSSLSDARTINFSFGPLNAHPALKDIRSRTIKLLIKIFSLLSTDRSKVEIIKTLSTGMHTPIQGNYTDQLVELVRENIEEVAAFYIKIIDSAGGLVTQQIEEQVNFLVERHKATPLKYLPELEAKIASNTEYNLFRTFVGYDYRIAKKDDWEAEKEERSRKIDSFVVDISEKNISNWLKKIKSVIDQYEDTDPSKFQYFFIFLSKLGKQKPEIAIKLIKENESLLERFLIHILGGVYESDKDNLAVELIKNWASKNRHLTDCAVILASSPNYKKEIFYLVAKQSIQNKNIRAINNIIRGTTEHYGKDKGLLAIFVEAVKKLTELHDTSWVYMWFKSLELLKDLNSNQVKSVLNNLVYNPSVDHDVEEILMIIADKYPEEVMNYFYKRLQAKELHKTIKRYEVLPFDLHELDEKLRESVSKTIPILLSWFDTKDELIKLRGSHFFEALFENFSPELEKALIEIIKSGDIEKAKDVLSILSSYRGQPFLHKTIHEFVKKYTLDRDTKTSLFIALTAMGTVTGEYGIVEEFKKKKREMQEWKKIKDPKIIKFTTEYEKHLDDMIAFEQTRADDMVAMLNKRVD